MNTKRDYFIINGLIGTVIGPYVVWHTYTRFHPSVSVFFVATFLTHFVINTSYREMMDDYNPDNYKAAYYGLNYVFFVCVTTFSNLSPAKEITTFGGILWIIWSVLCLLGTYLDYRSINRRNYLAKMAENKHSLSLPASAGFLMGGTGLATKQAR